MKLIVKWTQNLVFAVLILMFLSTIWLFIVNRKDNHTIPSIFIYKLMTVLSGSMEPAIRPGDMIIDKEINHKSVKMGDIVTYKTDGDILITHRVVGVEEISGQLFFQTKGDANNVEDAKLTAEKDLVGVLVLRIPYGGYVLSFINSRIGLILFTLIPVLILLTDQIKTILSELKKVKTAKWK